MLASHYIEPATIPLWIELDRTYIEYYFVSKTSDISLKRLRLGAKYSVSYNLNEGLLLVETVAKTVNQL